MSDVAAIQPYRMEFDVGTIKHLGLQMYSTLPPVIGELVANGWDANATKVEITIPEDPINQQTSEIIIEDDGDGMSDEEVRRKYLIIGRDRRENEPDITSNDRKIMGRKGIGKLSAFGIAKEIVIESAKDGIVSHFAMNLEALLEKAADREILFSPLPPTNTVSKGTKITLRYITKFQNRSISIKRIRRGLARRFSIIGKEYGFKVVINGIKISSEDRDLKQLCDRDMDGNQYVWDYKEQEIEPDTGWKVSGWIGALERTTPDIDGIDRGIVLMARGKLVQEPFDFNAVVGQQYALSYLIGELNVEFVDEVEDTIGTTRNSLVWDTERNIALMDWGKKEVNKIAREWSDKRRADNERQLQENELYRLFRERAEEIGNRRALNLADKLVRQAIENPTTDANQVELLIKMCLDFLEFDAFWEIAENIKDTELDNVETLIKLFREWEIVEAKEMARVTNGRIATIEKLQELIEINAREVPTMHEFLKDFPWLIDPRWTLVDDEVWYTRLLSKEFPKNERELTENRRIDFLCVGDGATLVVVEIKRPGSNANKDDLDQIERYVSFVRDQIKQTSGPDRRYNWAIGYLLCGGLVDDYLVREKRDNLAEAEIYVRLYGELLDVARRVHAEFLERYDRLQAAKQDTANQSDS